MGGGGFVAPSFGIRSGSNIMTPFGLLYADRDMFDRFDISVEVKPADDEGGFLFAILDPMDRLLQLGVRLDPLKGSSGGQNVSLFYATDEDGSGDDGEAAVTFWHPTPLGRDWNSLLVRVDAVAGTAAGYLNCLAMRPAAGDGTLTPGRLSFGLGSTLYVGQAGAEHGGAFEGVLQELKIRRRPAGVDGEVPDLDGVCAPAADLDELGESLDESEAPKSSAEEDLKSTVFDVAGLSGLSHEDVSGALPFNVRRQTSVNFLFLPSSDREDASKPEGR